MTPKKRPAPPLAGKHFWRFQAAADGNAPPELILYGDIAAESWRGDEVTPQQFGAELSALGHVAELVVRINSGGGDVFAANALYTRLKDNPARIIVKIDGWAASAATIVAMAGDVIEIPENGVFMLHDPQMGVAGYYSEEEFQQLAQELKVIKQAIVNGYALKTGKEEGEIAALMAAETWYDGRQAVAAGFCDRLMFEAVATTCEGASQVMVNHTALDLTGFPPMPPVLFHRLTAAASGGFLAPARLQNEEEEKERIDMLEEKDITTVEALRATYPDLTAALADEAGLAERKRIQDIEAVALPGYDAIVNGAKFLQPASAGDVAQAIVAAQRQEGHHYLAARSDDVKNAGCQDLGTGPSREGAVDGGPGEIDRALDKLFPENK